MTFAILATPTALALGYAFEQAAPAMKLRPGFAQSIEAQPKVDRLFPPAR